ncbi:CRNKL1 [Scenedesmus sp. PABB004]|nr:CRNKL1 [Scenedesmus sp. PABB004]
MKVKNKAPAARQITAEQLLRESKDIQLEDDFSAPKTIITDPEELAEYRLRKRKEFEDNVRRVGRWNPSIWTKYATWEESQKDFRRARSVWERAIDVDYTNVPFWLKYAEMEMRHRFVNHARNVWDRAVSLLPRVDQLWYKYIHMEEMVKETAKARLIFDRWMSFEPDHAAWMAYIKFELRYAEVERARAVYERYVEVLPSVKAWVRYAKFELQHNQVERARSCYERALEALGEDAHTEEFFLRFAEFEELVKEPERARAIFRYALDHLPKAAAQGLYARFVAFEKQHGSREGIEDVVLSKRRFTYEAQVKADPLNYDAWFDYVKLEESTHDTERIREVYERAVANLPPGADKRYWRRYVYLWIKYALFEELDAGDADRAREVYRAALKLVPHGSFTFAKLWLLAAKLEVRSKRLPAARRILGLALGSCPKDKLFREYIALELTLGNIDRCRTLYEKYLEWNPANATAWLKYAELELLLAEAGRARALYELAIAQPVLDMPEAVWKAYIDFEIGQGNRERTRLLYERLLDRTKHVKVWISFARFEAEPLPQPDADDEQAAQREPPPGEGSSAAEREARAARARTVYERGFRSIREGSPEAKEEAVMLLEAWRDFEAGCSDFRRAAPPLRCRRVAAAPPPHPSLSARRAPRAPHTAQAARRGRGRGDGGGAQDAEARQAQAPRAGGGPGVLEEYYDYIFPEDAGGAPNLKLLEAAMRWKRRKLGGGGDGGSEQQQQRGGDEEGGGGGGGEEEGAPAAAPAHEEEEHYDAGATAMLGQNGLGGGGQQAPPAFPGANLAALGLGAAELALLSNLGGWYAPQAGAAHGGHLEAGAHHAGGAKPGGGEAEERVGGSRGRTRSNDSRSSSHYASRHQQAEARRRTRINERLELLRKLVPHAERANTACFLEEVIKYIEQLKAHNAALERAVKELQAGGGAAAAAGGGGAAPAPHAAAAAAAAAAATPEPRGAAAPAQSLSGTSAGEPAGGGGAAPGGGTAPSTSEALQGLQGLLPQGIDVQQLLQQALVNAQAQLLQQHQQHQAALSGGASAGSAGTDAAGAALAGGASAAPLLAAPPSLVLTPPGGGLAAGAPRPEAFAAPRPPSPAPAAGGRAIVPGSTLPAELQRLLVRLDPEAAAGRAERAAAAVAAEPSAAGSAGGAPAAPLSTAPMGVGGLAGLAGLGAPHSLLSAAAAAAAAVAAADDPAVLGAHGVSGAALMAAVAAAGAADNAAAIALAQRAGGGSRGAPGQEEGEDGDRAVPPKKRRMLVLRLPDSRRPVFRAARQGSRHRGAVSSPQARQQQQQQRRHRAMLLCHRPAAAGLPAGRAPLAAPARPGPAARPAPRRAAAPARAQRRRLAPAAAAAAGAPGLAPTNVLLVGSGGREHALAWKLAQSELCGTLYAAPGNPGIAAEPKVSADAAGLDVSDHAAVAAFCKAHGVGLVVVGPEAPLVAGLADDLAAAGVRAFGPSAAAARLEGSKSFMKDLCAKHGIPTAGYAVFTDPEAAKAYVRAAGAPIVVKASGLAAGKGVIVAASVDEACAAVDDMLVGAVFGDAGSQVVIEEFLDGEEASFFALVDGEDAVALASAQDHKAAGDGDTGPNTGGMGAYSPAPVVTPEIEAQVMADIVLPTARAMVAEGCPFRGVLFAGLMIKDGRAKLLEHNVRFGDPECQGLMARLDSDLLAALLQACDGRLRDVSLRWSPRASLTVVMAAKGYPGAYAKGTPIGLPPAGGVPGGAKVFHAGTALDGGGRLVAAGGRVLGVTALGDDVAAAQAAAYAGVAGVAWDDAYYRTDIGWRAVARLKQQQAAGAASQ